MQRMRIPTAYVSRLIDNQIGRPAAYVTDYDGRVWRPADTVDQFMDTPADRRQLRVTIDDGADQSILFSTPVDDQPGLRELVSNIPAGIRADDARKSTISVSRVA